MLYYLFISHSLINSNDSTLRWLCSTYKNIIDSLAGTQTSEKLALIRKELLEIAANGSLGGKAVDFNVPGRWNYRYFLHKRISLMKFYAENPAIAKAIVNDEIIGFHGSTSGTLISVLDSGLMIFGYFRKSRS